jgi:hypothetical protein
MNKKSLNKIYLKLDSIAKQGIIGRVEYINYVDSLISDGKFAELQMVLERKYFIDPNFVDNVEYVKNKAFNILRLQTNSKFQEKIKKILDNSGVIQQGQNIYRENLDLGFIIESQTQNGLEITTFSNYNGTTYSFPTIISGAVSEDSLLKIYENSVKFLISYAPTTTTTSTTTTTTTLPVTTSTTTTTTTLGVSTTTTTTTLVTTSTTTTTTTSAITTSTTTTTTTTGIGSFLFDGITEQYLELVNTPDLLPGTSDFTVEWFQKQQMEDGFPRIFSVGVYPADFAVSVESGSLLTWINGSFYSFTMSAFENIMTHISVCRLGGTLSVYQNGELLGATFANVDITSTENMTIGMDKSFEDVSKFKGKLTNFHFVKGTSLYTGTFSVPSMPLTLSANTELLLLAASPVTLLVDSSGTGKTAANVLGVTWSIF